MSDSKQDAGKTNTALRDRLQNRFDRALVIGRSLCQTHTDFLVDVCEAFADEIAEYVEEKMKR